MPFEPFIGQIMQFAGTMPGIRGFVPCDGRLLRIQTNTALFSLLGNSYGGDGVTTFGVPDLRGRVPVGANGSGRGVTGGAESVALTEAQMPAHTHQMNGYASAADVGNVSGAAYATIGLGTVGPQPATPATPYGPPPSGPNSGALVAMAPNQITPTGAGAAHNNMQPSLVARYYIATEGLYPVRPD